MLLCVATMSRSSTVRWILRSRGKVDVTMRGWMRVETPEASSYSWWLQSPRSVSSEYCLMIHVHYTRTVNLIPNSHFSFPLNTIIPIQPSLRLGYWQDSHHICLIHTLGRLAYNVKTVHIACQPASSHPKHVSICLVSQDCYQIGKVQLQFLPAGRTRSARPAGQKIILPFPHLYIYICASALITCAIITSHTLLPCDFTLVGFGNLGGCFA